MKYSIITPCYKQENLICETLDSVLAQKSKDWEHLCTDDGGPDRTGEVLDDYVRSHCNEIKEYQIEQGGEKKRIVEGRVSGGGVLKIIHQKNAGMAGARNAAKMLSTGEWIINLDGDDLLSPFALQLLDKGIELCPDADMIAGGYLCFRDESIPDWGRLEMSNTIKDCSGPIQCGVATNIFQQMVIHRTICGDIKIEGANWSEEIYYTSRCVARIKKAIYFNAPIYGYRGHAGQFTGKGMTLAECKCYQDTAEKILDCFIDSGRGVDPRLVRNWILHWIEWVPHRILTYIPACDRAEAWRHWFSSLSRVSRYKQVSAWFRFVALVCRSFPYVPVAFVLCFIPYWLKTKGIHR